MNLKLFDYIKKKLRQNYVLLNKRKQRRRDLMEKEEERKLKTSFNINQGFSLLICISTTSSNDSIKPILVHDHSSSQHHHQHHVHVEDDYQQDTDEHLLTAEERGLTVIT